MSIRSRINQLRRKAKRSRINQLRSEAGKFTKSQAYYVDESFQKPIRCGNCEFYDGVNHTCDLVSEEGPPGPGRISREGTCSLFNARFPRIVALQWLWGREEEEGLAPEVARASAFMITYAALDEEPPAELREKAIISPEQIQRFLPRR